VLVLVLALLLTYTHVLASRRHGSTSSRSLAARRKADTILSLQTRRTRTGSTTHESKSPPQRASGPSIQQAHASTTAASAEHAPRRPLQQQASAQSRLSVARPYTRLLRLLESGTSTSARLGSADSLQHNLQFQPATSCLAIQQPTTAVLTSASSSTAAAPLIRLSASACKLWPRSPALGLA